MAGILFALLVMTRPDGLLFAAAGALSFWFPRDPLPRAERIRFSLTLATPVLVLLAIGIPAKLSYYGDFLPTAFYSKSVLEPYFSQGLWYLGLYLWKNWFLIAAAILGVVAGKQTATHRTEEGTRDGRFYLATAAAFGLYLVDVGGDFMFARRLIPIVPLVLIAIEDRINSLPSSRLRSVAALGLLVGQPCPSRSTPIPPEPSTVCTMNASPTRPKPSLFANNKRWLSGAHWPECLCASHSRAGCACGDTSVGFPTSRR